jgi:hypothetical protein
MSSWFNNAIADMLESCGWLLDGINKIRETLNMKPISVEALRAKADRDKSRIVDNNLDISGAWNKGYARGSAIGSAYQDKINAWGSGIKDKISGFGIGNLTDKVNATLGIKELPNVSLNPSDSLGDIGKGVGATADNTGKMADSMEMTKEDLEYLRRVADMEWKKEFTTASITVDMSNYNTISGDGDLDGIVTRLADKLYEELDMVANGVYA